VVTRPQKRDLFRVGVSQGDDFAHRCHGSYLKTQFSEKSIKKILKLLKHALAYGTGQLKRLLACSKNLLFEFCVDLSFLFQLVDEGHVFLELGYSLWNL
jgi:hypothetical protein